MKSKTILPLLTLMFVLVFQSQISGQKWIKTLSSEEGNIVIDIKKVDETKVHILLNGANPKLLTVDTYGEIISTTSLKVHFSNVYNMVIVDENVFVVGASGTNFSSNSVLVKINGNGDFEWSKQYDTGFFSSIDHIDNTLIVGGNIDSPGSSSEQLIMRLTMTGDIIWENEVKLNSNSHAGKILIDEGRAFVVSHVSTVGAGFEGFYVGEIDLEDGDYVWQVNYETGYFYDIFDYNYGFPYGACISGDDIFIVFPGESYGELSTLYKISKNGSMINAIQLFQVDGVHPHDVFPMENGDVILVGSKEKSDEIENVVERRNSDGELTWQKSFGSGTLLGISSMNDQIIVGGMENSYYASDVWIPLIASLTPEGELYNSGIKLQIRKDENGLCGVDGSTEMDEEVAVYINNLKLKENQNGDFAIDLPLGQHEIKYDLPAYYHPCDWPSEINVTEPNQFDEYELVSNINNCADLQIGITQTELIRGASNLIFVEYKNLGSITADNVNVVIKYDPRINIISASKEYEVLSNGQILFDIGELERNQRGRIALRLGVGHEIPLFTNLNIEARISPIVNCSNSPIYDFDIDAVCNDGELTFTIMNKGVPMEDEETIELHVDGYPQGQETFHLGTGAQKTITLKVDGQAGTVQLKKEEKVIKSLTYEGCGTLSNNYTSVGIAPQLNKSENAKHLDNTILEVRDHHTDARIFQTFDGLGRYNIITDQLGTIDYALRYVNDTGVELDALKAKIKLASYIDYTSIKVIASSHDVSFDIKNGELIVNTINPISPNAQFHCKFSVTHEENIPENSFVTNSVSFSNDGIVLGIENYTYINTSAPFELIDFSPFPEFDNGHILGKHGAMDFGSDLVELNDGSKIASSIVVEKSYGYVMILYKFDKYENLDWAKEYKFDNASPLINDVEVLADGNIMLVGSLDNKSIYNNYLSDADSYYLVIDTDGNEVKKERLTLGEGTNLGSAFRGVLSLENENILIIGYKYIPNSATHFQLVMDSDYNILSSINIQPPIGNVSYWNSDVVKGNDCITLTAFYQSGPSHKSSFTSIRKDGTTYNSNLFDIDLDDGDNISVYDSDVNSDGSALCTGQYWDYENGEFFDVYYSVVELNANQEFVRRFEVLPDMYYNSVQAVMKHEGRYFIAGSFAMDSLDFRLNAFLMETDSLGNTIWFEGGDLGARSECEAIFIGPTGNVYANFQTQASDEIYNLQAGYLYASSNVVSTHEVPGSNKAKQSQLAFPNPTNDIICIENDQNEYLEFKIISMNGKLELSGSLVENCIKVETLISGNYILALTKKNSRKAYVNFTKI